MSRHWIRLYITLRRNGGIGLSAASPRSGQIAILIQTWLLAVGFPLLSLMQTSKSIWQEQQILTLAVAQTVAVSVPVSLSVSLSVSPLPHPCFSRVFLGSVPGLSRVSLGFLSGLSRVCPDNTTVMTRPSPNKKRV